MGNNKLFKFSAHFSCIIETNNWLLTAIEAVHWNNIISKFGTFSCTEIHLVMFSNFISFFFGLVDNTDNKYNVFSLQKQLLNTFSVVVVVVFETWFYLS